LPRGDNSRIAVWNADPAQAFCAVPYAIIKDCPAFKLFRRTKAWVSDVGEGTRFLGFATLTDPAGERIFRDMVKVSTSRMADDPGLPNLNKGSMGKAVGSRAF
jgi:predicted metal-dependent hydrolase